MTAAEAREITDKNLNGEIILPYLVYFYQKIKEAAEEGRSSIDLWACIPHELQWPTEGVSEAVERHLVLKDKFKIEHHEDPTPLDPRSSDVTICSW